MLILLLVLKHPQERKVRELELRVMAQDSANRILARQEREAVEAADRAREAARVAREALAPATTEIRCVGTVCVECVWGCVCVCGVRCCGWVRACTVVWA